MQPQSLILVTQEVKNIISDFEPNYRLETVTINENEFYCTEDLQNLLTEEQFNILYSQI